MKSCTQIDALNTQILQLLAQRQHYVDQAADLKTEAAAIPAPTRQAEILTNIRTQAAELGMSVEVAETVFRSIMAAFIAWAQQRFQQHSRSINLD